MAERGIMGLEALLDKVLTEGAPEFLKETLLVVACKLMELEVTRLTGAAKGGAHG